jgi:hypothetical protein
MRLKPVLHLQPVFNRAQERVSIRQLASFLLRDEVAIGQPAETHERVRRPQPIV